REQVDQQDANGEWAGCVFQFIPQARPVQLTGSFWQAPCRGKTGGRSAHPRSVGLHTWNHLSSVRFGTGRPARAKGHLGTIRSMLVVTAPGRILSRERERPGGWSVRPVEVVRSPREDLARSGTRWHDQDGLRWAGSRAQKILQIYPP